MKHPRLSAHARIVHLAVIAAGLTLAGCEPGKQAQQQQPARIPVARSVPVEKPAVEKPAPRKALDLSLDKLAGQFVDTQAGDAEPDNRLIRPVRKNEDRIEFGGNLFTNENAEDYFNSIDGAVVNITIKTP